MSTKRGHMKIIKYYKIKMKLLDTPCSAKTGMMKPQVPKIEAQHLISRPANYIENSRSDIYINANASSQKNASVNLGKRATRIYEFREWVVFVYLKKFINLRPSQ